VKELKQTLEHHIQEEDQQMSGKQERLRQAA